MKIPILETDRLILRSFNNDTDFESYKEFFASESSKFYGGPLDENLAWRAASMQMGHWIIRGYGPWALEEKGSGDFCGVVGLWNPRGWPEPEITWMLCEPKRGKGFAKEAAIRARQYAYDELKWDRVVSCIVPENEASIRLALAMGAKFDYNKEIKGRGVAAVYVHAKSTS